MSDALHPLADLVLQSLTKTAGGWDLPLAAQRRVTTALDAYVADRDALRALVGVAHFLHRQGSAAAAQAVLAIAERAATKLGSTPRKLDHLQDRGRTFARFDGRTAALRAPQAAFVSVRDPSPYRGPPARV